MAISNAEIAGVSEERKELARRVFSICLASTTASKVWRPYLYEETTNNQPELRDKLFVVWVSALLDAAEQYVNRLNGLKLESKRLGVPVAVEYLDYFAQHMSLIPDHLSMFSQKEFIQITAARDQWVHGLWTESHKETRSIRIARNGEVVRLRLSAAEYWSAFEGGLIELAPLRDRFCNTPTFLWAVDRSFGSPHLQEVIYRDLLLSDKRNFAALMPDPTVRPHPGDPNFAGYQTFFEAYAGHQPPLSQDTIKPFPRYDFNFKRGTPDMPKHRIVTPDLGVMASGDQKTVFLVHEGKDGIELEIELPAEAFLALLQQGLSFAEAAGLEVGPKPQQPD